MLARRSTDGQAAPLPGLETRELTLMDSQSPVQNGAAQKHSVLAGTTNTIDIDENLGSVLPEVRPMPARACLLHVGPSTSVAPACRSASGCELFMVMDESDI